MIVRMKDLRSYGFCFDGVRGFFASNNLDWVHFLINGIDSKVLVDTGDHMAISVVSKMESKYGRT